MRGIEKIDSAVFPGLQGGPLMHVIASKAVALGEALRPDFQSLRQERGDQRKALAESLKSKGSISVSGGTDNHLMLVDLRPKRLTGKVAEVALGRAHITCNKNGIPSIPKSDGDFGVRLGRLPEPARLRRCGVPPDRRHDRRVLDVLSQKGVARTRWSRRGARQGEDAGEALPDLQ